METMTALSHERMDGPVSGWGTIFACEYTSEQRMETAIGFRGFCRESILVKMDVKKQSHIN